jgi:hypothetical protein
MEAVYVLCGRLFSYVGPKEKGKVHQEHMDDLSSSGFGDSILHGLPKGQCPTQWGCDPHRHLVPLKPGSHQSEWSAPISLWYTGCLEITCSPSLPCLSVWYLLTVKGGKMSHGGPGTFWSGRISSLPCSVHYILGNEYLKKSTWLTSVSCYSWSIGIAERYFSYMKAQKVTYSRVFTIHGT